MWVLLSSINVKYLMYENFWVHWLIATLVNMLVWIMINKSKIKPDLIICLPALVGYSLVGKRHIEWIDGYETKYWTICVLQPIESIGHFFFFFTWAFTSCSSSTHGHHYQFKLDILIHFLCFCKTPFHVPNPVYHLCTGVICCNCESNKIAG